MTEMQKSDVGILKADARGRVRTPVARRESLLEEFGRSGLSGPRFAALAGIKYSTFAAWVARRRKAAVTSPPVAPPGAVRWLEAVAAPMIQPTAMVLELPGGVRVEVVDERQVVLAARLVQALAQPC
jgi:hypothetical protein